MKKILSLLVSLTMLISFTACSQTNYNYVQSQQYSTAVLNNTKEDITVDSDISKENNSVSDSTTYSSDIGELTIYYIDVGQGDCELIISPTGKTMLIDTGDNKAIENIENILQLNNISKIDYLILTHPHADHIGSAVGIISDFTVQNIYMSNGETNTKTFEKLLDIIDEKDIPLTIPTTGDYIDFDNNISVQVLSPDKEQNFDDLNDYSIVLDIEFGKDSFIFMGDASSNREEEIMKNFQNLNCSILKLGHHGSSTASCDKFIQFLNPSYAIISCKTGNSYGHPHKETLSTLNKYNISYYQTNIEGTIKAVTDGENLTIGKVA